MARLAERLLAACAVFVLLLVCFHGRVPPLVMKGGGPAMPLPDGTEAVELEAAPGVTLRGRFTPAYPGAPVVLHLAEADARWLRLSTGFFGMRASTLAGRLGDLGFACLEVDYTGVGASDGRPSPAHLGRDARAMWNEAVRRAGGDPGRVVLHATSLGTLAASELLRGGARPGGAILVAPVLKDTAVARGAGVLAGPAVQRLAQWLAAPLAERDLRDACRAPLPPTLVLAGGRDRFTSPDERRELEQRVRAAGGTWIECDLDHYYLTRKGKRLQAEGVAFLTSLGLADPPAEPRLSEVLARLPLEVAERFRSNPEAYERLCAAARLDRHSWPLLLAASAWPDQDPETALRLRWIFSSWVLWGPPFWESVDLDFGALASRLDATDPAGELPLAWLEREDLALGRGSIDPAGIERVVARRGLGDHEWEGRGPFELVRDSSALWHELGVADLADTDRQRRFARLLLKQHELLDRLSPDASGEPVLEVLDGFTWRPFEFDPPAVESGVEPGLD